MDIKNISRRNFAKNLKIDDYNIPLNELIHLCVKGEYELIYRAKKITEIKNINNTEIRIQIKNPLKYLNEIKLSLDNTIENKNNDIFLIKMNDL